MRLYNPSRFRCRLKSNQDAGAHLDTTTIANKGFPLPTTKEWGEGKGEGPPNNVEAAETSPSLQPSPRSSLAGRGSDALRTMVVVSRWARFGFPHEMMIEATQIPS